MLIKLKNKDTLIVDQFKFKCSIGKNGLKKHKIEGDKCTPIGIFNINKLYYRKDRVKLGNLAIKKKIIKKTMGWSDDSKNKTYNKEIKIKKNIHHEKLFRKDYKYDYLLALDYNKKNIPYKGSAIFLHLTKDYKPTKGCITIKKKDFEILLKVIEKKKKIKIKIS